MATDYDAPRRSNEEDLATDSLEELKARRNEASTADVDVDETPDDEAPAADPLE